MDAITEAVHPDLQYAANVVRHHCVVCLYFVVLILVVVFDFGGSFFISRCLISQFHRI